MTLRTPCFALALAALTTLTGADAPPSRGLDIYFIDVMGGAATLVVTPERESVLIDTGWPGFDDRDPKRIEHVLKDVAGLDHLDHLVTTHWHRDHFGGVEGLAKRVRINHFWDRGLPEDEHADKDDFHDGPKPDDPLGIAYRKASLGKRKVLKAGDSLPLKGEIKALVLAASGKVLPSGANPGPHNPLCADAPADRPEDRSDNARSITLKFTLGAFDFLDCGDLTWNIEKQLVCPVDRIGPIDLYQVTHHGLDISNHPTLLQTIAPTVAVMNNGPTKGGLASTVHRLQSIASIQALYQLHKNAKTAADDNTNAALIANHDEAGGQYIHVSVPDDGARFNVRIGPDGRDQLFESK